jgi:hypothetical protein
MSYPGGTRGFADSHIEPVLQQKACMYVAPHNIMHSRVTGALQGIF